MANDIGAQIGKAGRGPGTGGGPGEAGQDGESRKTQSEMHGGTLISESCHVIGDGRDDTLGRRALCPYFITMSCFIRSAAQAENGFVARSIVSCVAIDNTKHNPSATPVLTSNRASRLFDPERCLTAVAMIRM
ncbi:hypothetical protein [Bradyrhizobium sp. ORS 375]|uniref:hypothetical protein n=1 Tax=Bradyrhizobium sp. (strain ORS 375) TaxID=566679 RepID=UPI001585698D|nr:hypothetical protein [Bradyrhizobium sp. ORS 375]